jgi:hypothetical protein
MENQAYMCPCCDSLLGLNEKGDLFILSSMSRRGVSSTHSGDPRFYQYIPDPLPPAPVQQQSLSTHTPPPALITDDSGELLVDDHTAALVHQALVKDLFDRGIISNTTDI